MKRLGAQGALKIQAFFPASRSFPTFLARAADPDLSPPENTLQRQNACMAASKLLESTDRVSKMEDGRSRNRGGFGYDTSRETHPQDSTIMICAGVKHCATYEIFSTHTKLDPALLSRSLTCDAFELMELPTARQFSERKDRYPIHWRTDSTMSLFLSDHIK